MRRPRSDSGTSLIELGIVVVVILALWLVGSASLLSRYGLRWGTVSAIAAPPVLLAALVGAHAAAAALRGRRAAAIVERVLAYLERGDPEAARQEFLALPTDPWNPETRRAIQDRRVRVTAAVAGPWPGRETAYRLHLRLFERYREDLSSPLRASLAQWPEDLFSPLLSDLARKGDARDAVRALLARTSSAESRRHVLANLFGIIDPVAPPLPTPEWLELLRPHRGELDELLRRGDYPSVPAEHLRKYLARMDEAP